MKGLWFVKKCVNSAEMYLILIEKHQMDGYSVLCSALYHVSRVSNNIVCIIFILYFIFILFSMVAAPSAPSRQGTRNQGTVRRPQLYILPPHYFKAGEYKNVEVLIEILNPNCSGW